jgi:hypothetical protein
MSHVARDPRLVAIPDAHLEYLRDVLERRGVPTACRILGVGRTALLGALVRGEALPGTAALIREAMRRKEAA